MSDGLVAIGESYVGGLWGVNASKSLDEVIAALMTIPMEARQEMYRSWSARIVALAARMFNYEPSSVGLIVGTAAEQFDLCPKFRRDYMDRYLHQGFGLYTEGVTNIEVRALLWRRTSCSLLGSVDRLVDSRVLGMNDNRRRRRGSSQSSRRSSNSRSGARL